MTRLPKAHLHLHLTGGMRAATLAELAGEQGVRLPPQLAAGQPLHVGLPQDRRGWWRFQHTYDLARSCLAGPAELRRLVHEMAEDEAEEGSGWVELQVDPAGYARRCGGLHPCVDTLLEAAAEASAATGVGIGLVIAASRTRHPLDAATGARLATQYADSGVVGFGLSNDELAAPTAAFAKAFRIAADAGLAAVPHAGELAGADSVRDAVEVLGARRVGHGVRAVEDPEVLALMADRGVAAEVCPSSNVALGVHREHADVPGPRLRAAGVPVVLGADDPLLFGSRLAAQYVVARHHWGSNDDDLAAMATESVLASHAPAGTCQRLLAGIGTWLAAPVPRALAPTG